MSSNHDSVTTGRRSPRGIVKLEMLQVLFDDEIFSIQIEGGISRYFTELMEGLTAVPDVDVQLPFRLTCNRYLAELPTFAVRRFFGGRLIPDVAH